ncbi:DNA-processing protein DprA [Streptacidiphilus rugosus]|uniref:DNA-processing protein DprA n=1 Tax=Streptacidiphilus rugosus TaxID=405783 RepID=UPI00055EDF03|nr:DNA-processing protein DprA [Streptacidiphilus rugosus]
MTSPAGDAVTPERVAWAALTRVVEPGDERAGGVIAEWGPVEALRRFVRALPAGVAAPEGERELARGALIGARLICPGEPGWPTQLDDLGVARPVALWARGAGSLRVLAVRSVAVVGARACTGYGQRMAADFAAGLTERGWTVFSGAAFGVDAAAHRGALAVGGPTVGVLACGVDQVYPRANDQLVRRIAERGLLLSELPLGAHPNRPRFLQRNRVIAALTRGTVVVEAARRSGSLNTARWAGDLGRHVMAVPGPVTSSLSAGTHELIRRGGLLVGDVPEIIEQIGAIGADLAATPEGRERLRDALAPETLRVLESLPAAARGTTVESLVQRSLLGPDVVLPRLYELASLGLVERLGAHWRLNPACKAA